MREEMWSTSHYLREIILGWYRRSQGAVLDFTPCDKFISLWISFNAWARHVSRKETDRRMIEWAKENNLLRQTFDSLMDGKQEFQNAVWKLKGLCPIPRHRIHRGSR